MSEHIVWLVDVDVSTSEAPVLARRGLEWLACRSIIEPLCRDHLRVGDGALYRPGPKAAAWSLEIVEQSRSCGLEVTVDRRVFHSDADTIRCPHCHALHSLEDDLPWSEAIDQWCSNQSNDKLECSACCRAASIVEWTFLELDWAFGNLGFGFNDWMIDSRLVGNLSKVLGHRVKVVHRHI